MPNPTGANGFFNTADLIAGVGTGPEAGDLRRKYNFGNKVSEINIASTPFFRFLSMVGKKPTDDPEFKSMEYRHQWQRRWAFVADAGLAITALGVLTDFTTADHALDSELAQADTIALIMKSDYSNVGKVAPYGQTSLYGTAGTTPIYLLKDQLLKVPVTTYTSAHAVSSTGYIIVQITAIVLNNTTDSAVGSIPAYSTAVSCKVIRAYAETFPSSGYVVVGSGANSTGTITRPTPGEDGRCLMVGTAYAEGTGYPETWSDQVSDIFGYTQIWKTAMKMNNTARATVLKGYGNEWARVWREKLMEHKMDIENDLLFGHKHKTTDGTDPIRYTQGAVDFVASAGNLFTVDLGASGTDWDDFTDNMGTFMDPRTNNTNATVFFCSTAVYNWLNKIGSGSFINNTADVAGSQYSMGRYNFNFGLEGKSKLFGVNVTAISTVHGTMNLVRNVLLDGSDIGILALNMGNCKYRPLVGNGLNRDTSVYVGVQTLENTGIDSRVDLILTEAGMEWGAPESHAIWKVV